MEQTPVGKFAVKLFVITELYCVNLYFLKILVVLLLKVLLLLLLNNTFSFFYFLTHNYKCIFCKYLFFNYSAAHSGYASLFLINDNSNNSTLFCVIVSVM